MTVFDEKLDELRPGMIAVLGVPFDASSSFLRGPALAPVRIREELYCESTNLWTENGIDLGATTEWRVVGDLDLPAGEAAFTKIESSVSALLAKKARVISLGGDHSITYPILRAYKREYTGLNVLHLDAHPDLYDELDGNRRSHACPFARVMEEKLAKRLVQVGIRAMTGHQSEQADRFGVEVHKMRDENWKNGLDFEGPVYLSLDIDCLDPAFAPGVSHYEPGGMSSRDVLCLIQDLKGDVVGADIVELNPERDPHGITARVSAKILKEIIGRMLE
jgi:agmatinase